MSTEAQKARNARKRAKLKLHKKLQTPWRTIVGPGWFIIKVSRRESKLWISWTHTVMVVGEGNPWEASYNAWHPSYGQFLDKVLDTLGDQECDPDSIQVTLVRYWLPIRGESRWYLSPVMDDQLIDIRLDLIERLKQRN